MALDFKPQQKINPQDLAAPKKYYAPAVSGKVCDFDELTEFISDQSTLSEADIYGVLKAVERTIIREMGKGRPIQLGGIGVFRLSLQSLGHEKPEEVLSDSIKKVKTSFRPGKRLKKMLKNMEFTKIQGQAA